MGFAVVADEVRNLAQRSAQAARDTAGLIEESITRSQEGVGKVEQVESAIQAITVSVQSVKVIVEDVRESSHQQTQGIDQVSQAIAQMERVTQSTAATAEESAAASEELNAQAEASIAVVEKLDAGWSRSDARQVARPAPDAKLALPAARRPGRGALNPLGRKRASAGAPYQETAARQKEDFPLTEAEVHAR
jgi:methyl-accepting chemotaxis protein/methyl-accepting chemotaxis protein-1 (serine sensor receptor)